MSLSGGSASGDCEVSTVQVPHSSRSDVDPRPAGQHDSDPAIRSDVWRSQPLSSPTAPDTASQSHCRARQRSVLNQRTAALLLNTPDLPHSTVTQKASCYSNGSNSQHHRDVTPCSWMRREDWTRPLCNVQLVSGVCPPKVCLPRSWGIWVLATWFLGQRESFPKRHLDRLSRFAWLTIVILSKIHRQATLRRL